MGRAAWAVALALLVTAGLVAAGSTGCQRVARVAAEEMPIRDRARDAAQLAQAPSATWTAVVESTGKPNQGVHILDAGVPPQLVQVEVRGPDGRLSSWIRVASLDAAGPDDHVFVVEVEDDGTAIVRFGDGQHGARPPAHEKGIRVRYHGGSGGAGQVVAVETGVRRLGDGGEAAWTARTVDKATADSLRERAGKTRYRVTMLRALADGRAVVTRYDVSGSHLNALLATRKAGLRDGESVLSVRVAADGGDSRTTGRP